MMSKPSKGVRLLTAAILIVFCVWIGFLKANHTSGAGDPCAPGAAPQVCEVQHAVDQAHARENTEAER